MWISVAVRGNRYVKVTDAEYAELVCKFDILWKAYKEQAELFYIAFVHKNKMARKLKDDEIREEKPKTPEEEAKEWRIAQMMKGIEKTSIYKQLTP